MDSKDYRLKLFNEYIENAEYIHEKEYDTLKYMASKWVLDINELRELRKAFIEGDRHYESKKYKINFDVDEEEYILSYENFEINLKKDNYETFLMTTLDILEDILPLGSVVDLRKDVYGDKIDIDNLRMVITYRYIIKEDDGYYFPYAGVVYPIGMLFDNSKVFHFTAPLIEKVVMRGYSDEADDVFSYYMKQEMIVKEGLHTYGYMSNEKVEDIITKLEIEKMRR